jgi:hypothetical protein
MPACRSSGERADLKVGDVRSVLVGIEGGTFRSRLSGVRWGSSGELVRLVPIGPLLTRRRAMVLGMGGHSAVRLRDGAVVFSG